MLEVAATNKITFYTAMWIVLLVVYLHRYSNPKSGTVGLAFAFIAIYTLAHFGAAVHLVPYYDHLQSDYLASWRYSRETVADGLEASFLGMIGALIGMWTVDFRMSGIPTLTVSRMSPRLIRSISIFLLLVGAVVFGAGTVISKLDLALPGLQAVLASFTNLVAVGGSGLILYYYTQGYRKFALIAAGAFSALLPISLLFSTAILANSIAVGVAILCFYLTLQHERRSILFRNLALVAGAAVLTFIISTAYLQVRGGLRDVIWSGGDSGVAFQSTAAALERLDLQSMLATESLSLLDARLNQNIFVGLAIEQLRILPDTFENGNTILLALFGWVPRFIWTTKPSRGGSAFLTQHTGKEVAGGTTFGTGPIFEFYVNFGYWGVLFGFIVLGSIVRFFDIKSARAIRSGNLGSFAQFHLAGIAILQPLSDLFFLVTSIASSLVVGWLVRRVLRRYSHSRAFEYPPRRHASRIP